MFWKKGSKGLAVMIGPLSSLSKYYVLKSSPISNHNEADCQLLHHVALNEQQKNNNKNGDLNSQFTTVTVASTPP